ncbi:MAG: XRE family transcriptional regulator, partial [Flavobacterium johnsoniae]
MVNTEDFIKRLEKILDYYNLTASSFADKIGVQRSSISHLLSGRNKPSLDFI